MLNCVKILQFYSPAAALLFIEFNNTLKDKIYIFDKDFFWKFCENYTLSLASFNIVIKTVEPMEAEKVLINSGFKVYVKQAVIWNLLTKYVLRILVRRG